MGALVHFWGVLKMLSGKEVPSECESSKNAGGRDSGVCL